MYTNPPLEVKENLRLLTEDLDNKIPAKQLDRNRYCPTKVCKPRSS